MIHARTVLACLGVLALLGCPSDDSTSTSDSQGDTTSATVLSVGEDLMCEPGTEGCGCDAGSCMAGLICVDDICMIDTESDSGPSTTVSDTSAESSGDATGSGSSSGDTADGSGSDTGGMTCTNSDTCPRGEVCTAPAESPEDFTCGTTCAGLGTDSARCTDDASCCGAFCSDGSCVAP